jgi:hypothetical protein
MCRGDAAKDSITAKANKIFINVSAPDNDSRRT